MSLRGLVGGFVMPGLRGWASESSDVGIDERLEMRDVRRSLGLGRVVDIFHDILRSSHDEIC